MPAAPEPLARLDLRTLDLSSGAAARVEAAVPVEDLVLGGQRYTADPRAPAARVDISVGASGRLFRLRLAAELVGPCWRCLEEARAPVLVDTREYAAAGRAPGAPFDEDLDCAYLEGQSLDVAAWARDAVVEELPPAMLCRADCRGLCPVCGADLNGGECSCPAPSAGDPRWSALGPLSERLRGEA